LREITECRCEKTGGREGRTRGELKKGVVLRGMAYLVDKRHVIRLQKKKGGLEKWLKKIGSARGGFPSEGGGEYENETANRREIGRMQIFWGGGGGDLGGRFR